MTIKNKFNYGDLVYLKTDEEQLVRMITQIRIRNGGYIEYEVSQGTTVTIHDEIEITAEKSVLMKFN